MKIAFLFLVIIAFSQQISALQFSPSILNFQTNQNKQSCKEIFFVLDSQATLSDTWAENENIPWRITQFTKSAQDHEIQLSYPVQISAEQTTIEVCLTPLKAGNYRGALVFRQGQTGNSIVQFVVWLNASVSEDNIPPPDSDDDDNEGGSSSSRSRNSNNNVYQSLTTPQTQVQNFEELDFQMSEEKIELNNKNTNRIARKSYLAPLLLVAIAGMLIILFIFLIALRKT